ncbi:uracil-DNA glycosylase [Candidatus Parcubacteria bacterium]|nr:MAG: uracil-DNA glycosylase [Candidatus Parcubacteria bacterium]
MNVKIEKSWKEVLDNEFQKDYFQELTNFVRKEYQNKNVFPKPENIFRAFDLCPFSEVRVVILGQDPYHGPNQAHGLCFSVQSGIQNPPSLKNIFKEISSDLNINLSGSGDLSPWARQRVFLLNSTLTVLAGQAGSHQSKGWEEFSDAVIQKLSNKKKNLVFLLWGSYAGNKEHLIDSSKHLVLKAPHPSPLSAYRGFFGSKHFSKTNNYLKENNVTEIDWKL